jgi:ABC-type antimicrobial peptide transport system permease subunit
VARLQPGVTLQQAQAEMAVLYRLVLEKRATLSKDPRIWEMRVQVEPAGGGLVRVRDQYGKPLMLLMVVVGLLLLLACINMASMLLARSAGRQHEIALRVGLGASRGRLARQMLTESILLSLAGMLVGILFAYLGTSVLVRIMASGLADQHIDIRVQPDVYLLLFTAGIALITGLLFGLAPAWYAFRFDPAPGLRQSGKGGDTRLWRLFGKGLVTAQVALAIFLVAAAAIFLNHLSRLRNLNLGFAATMCF